MDFDAVVLMARNDGYDLDTALQMARDAGVTSFTIYDTTLNKLTQRGELSLVTKLGADLYYPQFGITDKSYDYYLIGKPQGEKDLYFDEVVSDLSTRLGSDKVKVMSNGAYRIAGIKGVMPGLGDVNLGIMSADAKIISDHGFYVILRPTNYSNPTKPTSDHSLPGLTRFRMYRASCSSEKKCWAIRRSPANERICSTIRRTI